MVNHHRNFCPINLQRTVRIKLEEKTWYYGSPGSRCTQEVLWGMGTLSNRQWLPNMLCPMEKDGNPAAPAGNGGGNSARLCSLIPCHQKGRDLQIHSCHDWLPNRLHLHKHTDSSHLCQSHLTQDTATTTKLQGPFVVPGLLLRLTKMNGQN